MTTNPPVFPVFTAASGVVAPGAEIVMIEVAGGKKPALVVGEEGRGRKLAFILVENAPLVACPKRTAWGGKPVSSPWPWDHEPNVSHGETCSECGERYVPVRNDAGKVTAVQHPADRGEVFGRLMAATLLQNSAGAYKLVAASAPTVTSKAVIVLPTPIGFRGSNEHTGDRTGKKIPCSYAGQPGSFPSNPDGTCAECGARAQHVWFTERPDLREAAEQRGIGDGRGTFWHPQTEIIALEFHPFPGRVIAEGRIAQGDAGYAGGGEQIVAVLKRGDVFRTGYSGRLYGKPSAHYYAYDGERVHAATWDERIGGAASGPLAWDDWSAA